MSLKEICYSYHFVEQVRDRYLFYVSFGAINTYAYTYVWGVFLDNKTLSI